MCKAAHEEYTQKVGVKQIQSYEDSRHFHWCD